jgi:threonine/homoserine/homoserine lactone efflux protein
MSAATALLAGFVSGLAIAVQVGAVSLLLVDTALAAGPWAGAAAGLGVATADLGFAAVAVVAGGAAGTLLSGHEAEIRIVAAALLAGIAIHGLIGLRRERAALRVGGLGHAPASLYVRFLAITAVNPLTVASFAAVAASLSLTGFGASVAFVAGVGVASGAWHVVLTVGVGHAGRRITPRARRALAIGGRVMLLAIAVRLGAGA